MNASEVVRTVTVIVLGSLAFVSSVAALGVLWTPHASLGFGVRGLTITGVAPNSAAWHAGMRAGDELPADTPLGVRLRALWYDAYHPGQVEPVSFRSGGREKVATLVAVAHSSPFRSLAGAIVVLRVLLYVVFIVVGAALVLLRPARFTWAFFLCCIGLATIPSFIGWSFTVLDPIAGLVAYAIALAASALANVAFLAFAIRFPREEITAWRRILWRTLPIWLVALLAVDVWNTLGWFRGRDSPGWLAAGYEIAGFLAWALGTFALWSTYRSTEQRDRRRLQWVIVGCSVGYLAWYLDQLLANLGFGVAGRLVGVATLAMPLSVAYAVLKHRVIDFRFVLNRALTYSILASALVGALALSSWLTALLLVRGHLQIALQIAFALIFGASLQRVYVVLERALERAVFRRLRNAEVDLSAATPALASATSRDALDALLTNAPAAALELEYAATYRRDRAGDFVRTRSSAESSTIPDALAASESVAQMLTGGARSVTTAAGALALPIGREVSAIVLFGPHRNGFAVDRDEVALLERFTVQAGPAYDILTARAANAGRLGRLLRFPREPDDGTFSEALGEHILDALSDEDYRVLAACAAIPDATADEVVHVVTSLGARAALAELTAAEFLNRTAGARYRVHPLLQPVLVRRLGGAAEQALLRCAERAVAVGDYLRAAELYDAAGARGNVLAALASALERHSAVDETAFESILDRVRATAAAGELADFPDLVLALAQRVWPLADDAKLRAAARSCIARLGDEEATTRSRIALWLAFACAEIGELTEAADLLERFDDTGTSIVRAIVAGKEGDVDRCEAVALASEGRTSRDGALPIAQHVRAIYVERVRGRDAEARSLMEVAIARERSGSAHRAAVADAAFDVWLAGDRSSGATTDSLPADAHPRFVACARLFECVRASNTIEAQLLARLAVEAATSEPFICAIALVCLWELSSRRQVETLSRAAEIAERLKSPALRDAIVMMVGGAGECGMLQPLVRMIRENRPEAISLTVEVASACVRRGSDRVAIPERELALLIALAATPRPHPTATLIDTLWPNLDEANGAKALQTCVYRVRLRLGDAAAIASVAQGYRLGTDVAVDLTDAEHFVASVDERCDDSFVRLRLEAIGRHFGVARPAATLGWEWYDAVERRVAAVAREARRLLAEQYLRLEDPAQALARAREMLSADPIDEGAREIAIRAHLSAQNVAEAWRELRQHRAAVVREIDGEVSASELASLLTYEDDEAEGQLGERFVSGASADP